MSIHIDFYKINYTSARQQLNSAIIDRLQKTTNSNSNNQQGVTYIINCQHGAESIAADDHVVERASTPLSKTTGQLRYY